MSDPKLQQRLLEDAVIQQRVEQFLFHQPELLDDKQWGAYIDLFADEGVYWMPATPGQTEWPTLLQLSPPQSYSRADPVPVSWLQLQKRAALTAGGHRGDQQRPG